MQTLLSISGLEIVMVVFIYDVSIHNMKKSLLWALTHSDHCSLKWEQNGEYLL